jgi:REP element-mobilizing transposase RayT
MKKLLGYMLTWTTYGCWLQGDHQGYVKDSKILPANPNLESANKTQLQSPQFKLNNIGKNIVRRAITEEAKILGQEIYAISVYSNHVHLVVNHIKLPIEKVVSHYKNAARLALHDAGFGGKLWTRGFDKRFCFSETELTHKIAYVQKHNEQDNPRRKAGGQPPAALCFAAGWEQSFTGNSTADERNEC